MSIESQAEGLISDFMNYVNDDCECSVCVDYRNRADTIRALLSRNAELQADAGRYRFLRGQSETGAVRTLLPLVRSHYVIVNESAYDYPTFDAAVDAAIAFAQQPLAGETP